MTNESNPNYQNNIEMNVNAFGDGKATQIGQLNAQQVQIIVDGINPAIERIEQLAKPESPGILKAGNPNKSSANWQGRTAEIANLKQWLNNPNIPLIGIEGIGGIGKSMLSAYIYENETIAGFRKRFWADVSSGAIFTDVATQVLQDFGFQVPEQETQLVQTLVKCLQSDEFLLIIDNLESLLKTNGIWGSQFYEDFFKTWVECGGKSKVIVTTRERPELPKRFQWLPLSGLKIADGVALLTDLRIQGNLEEFVKLVDGYPLLLRFVADLLIEEYPQDPNLKRLENLGLGNLQQLLTDKKVVGQHRLENVGMVLVLDASFERLNELQKSLLQNISVYRGVVNAKAAMAVCLGSSETEIERELRNLVKRSFLSEKLIDDGRWFEFQPVVLEYVRYKAGDQTEAHQKAINYYQSIAKQQPWQTKQDIKEYLEIFYHWYQLKQYDAAFNILIKFDDFLTFQGHFNILVDLCQQLIKAWDKTGEQETGKYGFALNVLGNVSQLLGHYKQAIDYHQQSLRIKKQIGDRDGEGDSLGNLGNVYNSLGEYPTAINYYEQSLLIARERKNRNAEGTSLNNLGIVYHSINDYRKAIEYYDLSWQIKKEMGDRNGESNCLTNLGVVYRVLQQYQRAIEHFQHSLQVQSKLSECKIGDRRIEGNTWFNLGGALVDVGRELDALGAYRNAYELYQDMELEKEVQLCNNAIERLSQPKKPVVSQRGFWGWLRRLWRWVRSWFRR